MRWKKAIWIWGLLALILAADRFPSAWNPAGQETQGTVRQAVWNPASQAAPASAAPEASKEIALTFDDGPHPVYTAKLLDGLKERGVHVSFFLIGENIDGNEDIIKRMKEEGHLIGNHSQNHMQLTKENASAACQEIERTNQKICEITGERPTYIRPPYGSWSEELECMIPMTVALWNVDPLDWKTQDTQKIVRHVKKHADDGSIVLLHDVYETSVDAALELIDALTKEGYHFVTVDELLVE